MTEANSKVRYDILKARGDTEEANLILKRYPHFEKQEEVKEIKRGKKSKRQ